MDPVAIAAIGHFHPSQKLDNDFFDELDIGSSSDWIRDVTGIESRRSVLSHDQIKALKAGATSWEKLHSEGTVATIADMSVPAWQMMQERLPTPLPADAIDMVICGTSVPDFDIPANASTIASRLAIRALAFDLNSACSSFVADVHAARALISVGAQRSAAIFNVERYTGRVNFNDRSSCVLWGDGATAALLKPRRELNRGLEIVDSFMESDPEKFQSVIIPVGGCFSQNGKAVQKFAITRTVEITRRILERNNLTTADIRWFVGHQANLRMLTTATDMLKLPPERHLFNVDQRGNQGGAGAPAVLSANWDRYQPGDLIAVSVVGAGLTWGALLLRAF